MITLEKAYSNYQMPDRGGDKGTLHSYIDVYAEYISPRTKSLLEVGVFEGHSLMMWQTYLPKARIVGLDTNVRKCQFDVDVRECNATVGWQIIEALGDETFEVIIDDGSHRLHDQIATFDLLWPRVEKGGAYWIEDIAGTKELDAIVRHLERLGHELTVWDLRTVKGRFDDILVRVCR